MWLTAWPSLLVPGALLYLYAVKRLRFRRANTPPSQTTYTNRESLARMTLQDAWAIHNALVEYEFPTTFSAATMFALFNSYGIPTISALLCRTGEFTTAATAEKRYTDTGCLLLEAVLNPPGDERSVEALARINHLHRAHLRAGRISGADMLYTLSLFALQPARWVEMYEWRALTEVELCAVGVLWRRLGEALGVKYDALTSQGNAGDWADGIEFLEALETWSRAYQAENMIPATSNHKVARATLDHILWKLPSVLRPVGEKLAAAILEDDLREAMILPTPSRGYYTLLHILISIRKQVLLHLTLPRRKPKKRLPVPTSSGRFHTRKYTHHPWYIKPTLKNRWGLKAWLSWLQGGVLPGDPRHGDKYFPQGFAISELGPMSMINTGSKEMERDKEVLRSALGDEYKPWGCPLIT